MTDKTDERGETENDPSGASGAGAERAALVARAGVVGAGTLASRLLGLGRDMALAAVFRRDETDAFFVAFTIPNALRQLLGEGVVSSAVIPVLSNEVEAGGDERGVRFFARARGVSYAALTLVTVLGVVFAAPLSHLFADEGAASPAQFERLVAVTRLVFPYILFMGTAALGMAALHTKRRFAVASFAPALLNVAFIAAAFIGAPFAESLGYDRTYALAIGALIGGALQVWAQWPALRAIGYNPRPVLDLKDPAVRTMLHRIAPMAFGIGVYYIDLVISRRFLYGLGTGAQSYFTWAMRLCDFPQGIFVMALSTAALPSLATLAARGEKEELARTYSHAMRLSLFVALPASVAFVVLARPLVVLLFQRGAFTDVDATETARALVWQGGALFTVTGVRQLVPVLHSLGDTRTPVIVSAIDLVAFIVLAVTLRGPLGHVGISVAVAGSSAVQFVLLAASVKWRLGTLRMREIGASTARIACASLAAGAGAWGAATLTAPSSLAGMAPGPLARVVPGLAGAAVFVVLYLGVAWGMRARELEALLQGVRRRLGVLRSAG